MQKERGKSGKYLMASLQGLNLAPDPNPRPLGQAWASELYASLLGMQIFTADKYHGPGLALNKNLNANLKLHHLDIILSHRFQSIRAPLFWQRFR